MEMRGLWRKGFFEARIEGADEAGRLTRQKRAGACWDDVHRGLRSSSPQWNLRPVNRGEIEELGLLNDGVLEEVIHSF